MNIDLLNSKEQQFVKDILSGHRKLKIQLVDKNISANVRKYLAGVYNERDTLTVAECCVWLNRTFGTIYEYINDGKVIAYRFGGKRGNYTIDVAQTKKVLGIK